MPSSARAIADKIKHVEADPDMDSIRDDPRFKAMMSGAKQRLGVTA